MLKRYLLTPGPTPVPPEVLLRMSHPLIHHRTPEFSQLFAEVQAGLRWLFRTEQDVLILAASGTGAMEAAVANTAAAGDTAIVVNGGKFGERWLKICQAFAVRTVEMKVEWGRAVTVEAVAQALHDHPEAKAVLLQASETSTTVLHPVREIATLTRGTKVLLIVDGITAVGATEVAMDQWGIDVLVTGSQKALMLPPGLAFLALSAKAWDRVETATLPRFYFDLRRERKEQQKHTTAYTPAISLIYGLHEVLRLLRAEGLEHVFARHAHLAAATRAAAQALGMRLLAPDHPSPAATGIWLPPQVDGSRLLTYLRDRMGVDIAGGQDHLKGKIARISHIGYAGPFDVITAIGALEMALYRHGCELQLGSGVRAAEEVLLDGWPLPG
ncbi:MAG TPA: alanine--glyoxylate aminotransferase family protein [Candidatus Binatia bacterium]|nr:alanine--glyoxylate aminotransferase family protein [Candidatus Binatia bacterium]